MSSASSSSSTSKTRASPCVDVYNGNRQHALLRLIGDVEIPLHSKYTPIGYKCHVYGSSDCVQLGILNASVEFKAPGTGVFTLEFGVEAFRDNSQNALVPYFLHFDLFTVAGEPEMHTLIATKHLAHGEIDFVSMTRDASRNKSALHRVELFDIERQKQAVFTLRSMESDASHHCLADFWGHAPPVDVHRKKLVADYRAELIQRTQKGFEALRASGSSGGDGGLLVTPTDVWDSYPTFSGATPLVAFVHHACMRQCHDAGDSEKLLLHWMRMAGCMYGRELGDFESASDEDKGDWLTEMCTLYFRGLLYSHDYVRTRASEQVETDQWSCLNAFPADGLTAYDCEDGAEFVMEVLALLRHGTYKSAPLQQMQAFYSHYSAFLTLGELRSLKPNGDEAPVPHAYVMLLDTRYVRGERDSRQAYKPAIVIESTTYLQGCFTALRTHASNMFQVLEQDAYQANQQVFSQPQLCEEERKWRRVCKMRCRVPITVSKQTYGTVWNLIGETQHHQQSSSSSTEDHITHFALSHHASHRLGVHALDLLMYENGVAFHTVLDVGPGDDMHKLEVINRENPRSYLPRVPPNAQDPILYPMLNPLLTRFTVRAVDFEQPDTKERFMQAFAGAVLDKQAFEKERPVKLWITDKVAAYAIDVQCI